MSWSVNVMGRAEAVRTACVLAFNNMGKCPEPEETIKGLVLAAIEEAAAAAPECPMQVTAHGSQGTYDGQVRQTLSLKIEMHGQLAL